MKTVILLFIFTLQPTLVWSGSLSYQYISISEAHIVFYGAVLAIDQVSRIVKIKILKSWKSDGEKNQDKDTVSIEIQKGVDWNDSRVSPVEMHFHGWKEFTQVKVGEHVYIAQGVRNDIVEPKTNLDQKLNFIFGKKEDQESTSKMIVKKIKQAYNSLLGFVFAKKTNKDDLTTINDPDLDLLYEYLYDPDVYLKAIEEFYLIGEIDLNRFYKGVENSTEKKGEEHFHNLLNKLIVGVTGSYFSTDNNFNQFTFSGLDLAKACISNFQKDRIEIKVQETISQLYNFSDKKLALEYMRDNLSMEKYPQLYRDVIFQLESKT